MVCVCNSDFCDLPGQISAPEQGSNTRITSSKGGLRFAVETSLNEASAADGKARTALSVQSRFLFLFYKSSKGEQDTRKKGLILYGKSSVF